MQRGRERPPSAARDLTPRPARGRSLTPTCRPMSCRIERPWPCRRHAPATEKLLPVGPLPTLKSAACAFVHIRWLGARTNLRVRVENETHVLGDRWRA